uniref:Reverse transcriptase domain-containing protein n=1 Tax=Strongyloides stercoralis TaxID=6248 RepID=A0A0K0EEF7_STRER
MNWDTNTIPYGNICIPMLHTFMGLVKDAYNSLVKEMKADMVNGTTLIAECDNFLKKFNVPYQEYYQTFSGNGVQKSFGKTQI